jgi:vacuolar-type H+-ATPase subunit H
MIDYSKGKIYKLICNTTGLIYIGSTCKDRLCERLSKHKSHYKEYLKNGKSYITSFKILENNNYVIDLIEMCPCNTKDELNKRERYYIEMFNCVNKIIPTRSIREYREQNKEKLKEYREKNKDITKEKNKEYREKNKDIIKEKKKEYREKNKDVLKEKSKEYSKKNKDIINEKSNIYYYKNKNIVKEKKKQYNKKNKDVLKEKSKEYREKNKDVLKEKSKEYREKNKDKINEKAKKKYTCECGSNIRIHEKNQHLKSNKHKQFIKNTQDINFMINHYKQLKQHIITINKRYLQLIKSQ